MSCHKAFLNLAPILVNQTRKFEHITPVLFDLHWLPVSYRIVFKILLLNLGQNKWKTLTPPPPKSKMGKWRVLTFARLHPWFGGWGVGGGDAGLLFHFILSKIVVFKSLNNLSPSYLGDRLSYRSHSRNLRSASKQLLEQPRWFTKTYGDKAFSVCAPKLWNSLQLDLVLRKDWKHTFLGFF